MQNIISKMTLKYIILIICVPCELKKIMSLCVP